MYQGSQQQRDDIKWLRDYKLHQENILYSRINIFIVVSSIFVGSFCILQSQVFLAYLAWLAGAALTRVLWLAIRRQSMILNDYRDLLYNEDPVYRNWRRYRKWKDKARGKEGKPISGQKLMFDYLPRIFGAFWAIALAWLILRSTLCFCSFLRCDGP
ncbi:MAG: hypothetical protein IID44_15730 [Planctomycetes bacterium]|nr:hypothetical protein [Planctomycetota bacterium]